MQAVPRYGMRPPEVAEAFGSRVLFEEAVKAGLLKPMISRHKLTIYDSGAVARAWARILAGELPEEGKPLTHKSQHTARANTTGAQTNS